MTVQPLFPPGHPRHIPEAWPALLSEDQLRAYVGGISRETLVKICPVAPVDLGANLLRYQRGAVDQWISNLQLRPGGLRKTPESVKDAATLDVEGIESNDQAAAALQRVQARARRSQACRKTG